MTVPLTARNATAADLVSLLNTQKAAKLDVVVPSASMKSVNGLLIVRESEAILTDDGVTPVNGTYRPTDVFDDGASLKLGIPRQYMRRMRDERPDMLDQAFNGWLHGRSRKLADGSSEVIYPPSDKGYLLRLFRGDGGTGVARAMLSDRYALSMDNLDVLTAVMRGIADAGVNVITRVSDLSERGMRVRFECPDIWTEAPALLEGYKSPFDNGTVRRAGSFDVMRQQYGAHHIFGEKDAPVCFIGFDLVNNETGGGACLLTPLVEVARCTNGLVMRKEGIRRVHLGAKMEQGIIRPSLDTLQKAGALVSAETRDAVKQWLTPDYLRTLVAGLTQKAGTPVAAASETVPAICAGLGFTPDEQRGILDMFISGGQVTAGGLMQAVSAYAQTIEDVDRAYEVELKGIDALEAAAR